MGWRDKDKYFKSLSQMFYDRLTKLLKDKKLTFEKYHQYREYSKDFAQWIKINHPEVTSMKKSVKLIQPYMMNVEAELNDQSVISSIGTCLNMIYDLEITSPNYYINENTTEREKRYF